jgi:hypothetical protein
MRPIAFAAAQLNVALSDGAVSPILGVPFRGSVRAAGDDGDDVVAGEVFETPGESPVGV